MKYKYTRKEIQYVIECDVSKELVINLLLATKKPLNSGGVKSGKYPKNKLVVDDKTLEILQWPEDECTVGPYCKCEDCRNYEGDLPIDRV
jgi:hypothetical protein